MFEVGNLVMYGIHGACRIVDVEIRTVDRKKVEYLVLEPQYQQKSRFYVPSGNPTAMAKLRPMLTRQTLEALLSSEEVRKNNWIPDENARKQYYRELTAGADHTALLQMVFSLYQHRQEQAAAGRKLHLCDENFLRDAQRLIESEYSVVLGITPEEVRSYVQERLSA